MEAQSHGLIQGSILALVLRTELRKVTKHLSHSMVIAPGDIHGQLHAHACHKHCSSRPVVSATEIKRQTFHICVASYDALHCMKCLSMLKSKFGACHNINGCEKHGLEIVLQVVVRSLVLCNWVLLGLISSFNTK